MKTASLALFVLSLSFSAVSSAGPCAPVLEEIMALRDTRIALCESNGPNHADCVAQESYEFDFVRSVIRQCPANSSQCQAAQRDYLFAWSRRSQTCHSAGSSTAPSCVSAQGIEDNRFNAFASCLLNDW